VQLLRTVDKSEEPRPYTINFLVFVKNKEIFKNINSVEWDGLIGISYTDGVDTLTADVLMKKIKI
ncbi:hypothetical protein K8T06_04390, partial [bacterium]|nr:hypothetical protein [bacterium]